MGQSQDSFKEEFERVLVDADTSVRRLARLSGVPRRTLENWLYGRTRQPRHVEPILDVARALHLPAQDVDHLLLAAGHPTLNQLRQSPKRFPPESLGDWQIAPNTLLGQKSAALHKQHNLPAAATPFLGQQEALQELAGLLRQRDVRLVTVTGLGGAGKTRVALETARALLGRFDHGIYFIPLDNVHDAGGFWAALLNGLDIPSGGTDLTQRAVENYLQQKQILLLLDNFEHLLPLVPEIAQLLAQTERVKLLVTSRQALTLNAEHLFPVHGLSYRDGSESPAYQLFLQAARRRVPAYAPSPQEVLEIIELCARVEGLPLAIELAASWMDVLTPAAILESLESDLHDVCDPSADRPSRQQSLWHLFDYSWQMLAEDERETAVRLSVMRGSFSPAAAMAVAGTDAAVLKRLVQVSFLHHTAENRLLLHPLVRQFLGEQALSAGFTMEQLEERFMSVTLNWAGCESRLLRETFKAVHYQNLHREWQHVERAWWLAVDRGCADLLAFCWDLLFYFEVRGTWGQGIALFTNTRARMPAADQRFQARLDEAEAFLYSRLHDVTQATNKAKLALKRLAALDIGEADDAGRYARLVLTSIAYVFNHGAFDSDIERTLRQVTAGYFDKFAEITIQLGRGVACYTQNDFTAALTAFQKAMEVSGPGAYVEAAVHCYIGVAQEALGYKQAAAEQFRLARQKGLALEVYPAVITATFELRQLAGDDPSYEQSKDVLEQLALEMGSRRTVGRVAIYNAFHFLNIGKIQGGRMLTRIGVGMIWNEVNMAERAQILSTIAKAYLAFGLAKNAPQVLALVAPKVEPELLVS